MSPFHFGRNRSNPRTQKSNTAPLKEAAGQWYLENLETRRMLAAVVTTDLLDYAPESTAHIDAFNNDDASRTDFAVGETVQFQVLRTDGQPDFPDGNLPWRVVDGNSSIAYKASDGVWVYPDLDGVADGEIKTTWHVEEQYANSTLRLTASGLSSGAVATHDFTDGVIKAGMVSSAATDSYTLTYKSFTSTGTLNETGSVTITKGLTPNVNAGNDPITFIEAAAVSAQGKVFAFWTAAGSGQQTPITTTAARLTSAAPTAATARGPRTMSMRRNTRRRSSPPPPATRRASRPERRPRSTSARSSTPTTARGRCSSIGATTPPARSAAPRPGSCP